MKNRAFFFFCLFILTIMVAVACGEREMLPNQPPSIEGQKDEEGIEGYLARLCSERMEGREGGKKVKLRPPFTWRVFCRLTA